MEQVFSHCAHDSLECRAQLMKICKNDTYSSSRPIEALDFYPWQLILIVLYSITSFLSVGSNLLTVIILLRREQTSTELWKFLINLSFADISMAIFCIPFTYTVYMLGQWIFPHFLCRTIYFVQTTSVTVSIWTLTAIGIDRYFAIIYPFRSILWLKKYKYTAIFLIWIFGIIVAMPLLLHTRIFEFCYRNEMKFTCREDFSEEGARLYTVFLFLITFLIPLLALSFVYLKICLHLLHHSAVPGNPDKNRDKINVTKKMKVIKMLLTIVIVFAVCWLPIHLFQLCVWFYPDFQMTTNLSYYGYIGSYFASHWMAMAHSFVNPFVYCFMSDNFRHSLRSLYQRFTKEKQERNRIDMAFTQSVMLTEGRSTMSQAGKCLTKKTSFPTSSMSIHNQMIINDENNHILLNNNGNGINKQNDFKSSKSALTTKTITFGKANVIFEDEFI